AAIDLAKDKNKFLHKQTARLSPNVTVTSALLILVSPVFLSWYFFVHYTEHIACILSVIAIGVALIAACLVAMLAGHLSQANFVAVVKMVWSKISGNPSHSTTDTADTITAETGTGPSEGNGD